MYKVEFTDFAMKGVEKLMKFEPEAYKRLLKLLEQLEQHPTIGTGLPKPLRENRQGTWSRRITDKHRLVYEINGNEVLVLVLSAYGHYDDK